MAWTNITVGLRGNIFYYIEHNMYWEWDTPEEGEHKVRIYWHKLFFMLIC
jgi:hypothetical protein